MNAKEAAAMVLADPPAWFPAHENYVGPTKGMFTLLHHQMLVECSHDVLERLDYIRKNKDVQEQKIRLRHIVRIPIELMQDATVGDIWAGRPDNFRGLKKWLFWFNPARRYRRRVIKFLNLVVTEPRWDEKNGTLVFDKEIV